jgi:glutathione S-transferase
MQEALKVIGGHESYFTGKLEAYLRAKGIPYQNVPFTLEGLQQAAAHTGFFQIPQVACPDGSWLVDTTLIIDYLDRVHPEPRTSPTDPATNFIALLLEDYADEWLWRPAMHYRWSFDNSAELLSSWLAEHSPEADVSLVEKKAFFYERQKSTFVDGDGVTGQTRAAVESSYHHALTVLEAIFAGRDFILGDRPTQADFGFMGPMFRHFFCDPDPARLMRDTAPGVHEWVARMWNMKPQRFSSAVQIESIPGDLGDLLEPVVSVYLPYLLENQKAVIAGQEQVSYDALGVSWTEPAKPFRLWCLDQLRINYQSLEYEARARVVNALGAVNSKETLSMPPTRRCEHLVGSLPYPATENGRTAFDSWGRQLD